MSYTDALNKLNSMTTEEISEQIHPYIQYEYNDKKMIRKMVWFIIVTDLK